MTRMSGILTSFHQYSFAKLIDERSIFILMIVIQIIIVSVSLLIQSLLISMLVCLIIKKTLSLFLAIRFALIGNLGNLLFNYFLFSFFRSISFQAALKISSFPISWLLVSIFLFFHLRKQETQLIRKILVCFSIILTGFVFTGFHLWTIRRV
ncbi:MAG: hypothetical protein LBT69_04795 [Lactobacillales bacterium]|nr:hypothetical protein [Lactobacillales bacterium]